MAKKTRPVRALPLQKETAIYCSYTLQRTFMSYQTNLSKRKVVKRCHPLNGTASLGRGIDAPQARPDLQQATALNSKLNLKKKIKRIPTDKHESIYSGGSIHERGVGLNLDNKDTSKSIKGYWGVSDSFISQTKRKAVRH